MSKNQQTFSIRESAEILVPDKLSRTCYLGALLIAIVMFAIIGLVYAKLPPTIPFYFTLPWGEERLTGRLTLVMLPFLAMAFTMLNIILGRLSAKLSPLLPRVASVAALSVAFMLLIATYGIIQSLIL